MASQYIKWPFVDQHIIYPYFVPISPHWAEVETSIFQLVGLDPDTTYRIFPPDHFYPPASPCCTRVTRNTCSSSRWGSSFKYFNSMACTQFTAQDTGTD
ncbi:hypothetical protein PG984_005605 [Apiospora sp. TS-2023a]